MPTHVKYFRISLILILALNLEAAEREWPDLSLRVGFDNENKLHLNSYELLAQFETPWEWTVKEYLEIELGFEFGLGALNGESETGLLVHLGPTLEIEFDDFPLVYG